MNITDTNKLSLAAKLSYLDADYFQNSANKCCNFAVALQVTGYVAISNVYAPKIPLTSLRIIRGQKLFLRDLRRK